MRIKSYFAATVEDAVAQARQELGAEAMLVSTSRAPAEARHLGDYEVVFASIAPPPEEHQQEAVQDRLAAQVAELKRELEGMRRALTHSVFAPSSWPGAPPASADAYAQLAAAEVTPDLAREIVRGAESRAASAALEPAAFRGALVEELQSRIAAEPVLGRSRGDTRSAAPHVTALVGPPGAGKTTTLVKLAANYGIACRRPVVLLSADTYRVAAAEQLRHFAAILGVGLQVVDTVAALAQALEECRGKDLVLIDTPGFAGSDMDHAAELARFFSHRSDVDTQLVLPASMKPPDLTRMIDAFAIFHPQRLLFTRLDETCSCGPILNESVRIGKPLSFFANGQRIPEDIETASAARLVELLLAGGGREARSAA